MFRPSLEEFKQKAKKGNLIPVYREILADMETPVSAFLSIDDGRHSFLLESMEGGEKWARYSFLGSRPSVVVRSYGNRVEITRNGKTEERSFERDPLEAVQNTLSEYSPVPDASLPRFFGGAVGFMGYDVVRFFESLPNREKSGLDIPDIFFMITDTLVIFDNITHRIKVVSNAHVNGKSVTAAYKEAMEKIVIDARDELRIACPYYDELFIDVLSSHAQTVSGLRSIFVLAEVNDPILIKAQKLFGNLHVKTLYRSVAGTSNLKVQGIHAKLMISDKSEMLIGSFNFKFSHIYYNVDLGLLGRGRIADHYARIFDSIWGAG